MNLKKIRSRNVFFIFVLFVNFSVVQALALSVEDAYRSIPVKRTAFYPDEAKMPAEEREALEDIFRLVDLAIVEKVEIMQGKERVLAQYSWIIYRLQAMHLPGKLSNVHALIMEAIKTERDFLQMDFSENTVIAQNPKVLSASSKLHAAYNELIRIYPEEGSHNKEAFYHYLCALDFI